MGILATKVSFENKVFATNPELNSELNPYSLRRP